MVLVGIHLHCLWLFAIVCYFFFNFYFSFSFQYHCLSVTKLQDLQLLCSSGTTKRSMVPDDLRKEGIDNDSSCPRIWTICWNPVLVGILEKFLEMEFFASRIAKIRIPQKFQSGLESRNNERKHRNVHKFMRNCVHKNEFCKIWKTFLFHKFNKNTAFFPPILCSLPENKLKNCRNNLLIMNLIWSFWLGRKKKVQQYTFFRHSGCQDSVLHLTFIESLNFNYSFRQTILTWAEIEHNCGQSIVFVWEMLLQRV